MPKFIFSLVLLFFVNLTLSQELSEKEINRTRIIQELLISNPEKAYTEALKIASSKDSMFSFYGKYYEANYFYNKSDFFHSKKLLVALIENIEKSTLEKSSKAYQDLMSICINKLFYIYKNLTEYDKALQLLEKYKSKIPNKNYNNQYGSIKVEMGDYENGIALLKKDLRTSAHLKLGIGEKKVMNKKLFADRYNTIGEAYQKYYIQSKKSAYLDSANHNFRIASNMLIQENFQPEYTKAILYMHEAKSAALAENYAKSLSLYSKRKDFPIIKEHIRTEQLFDLGMADCFHHLNQVDSALYYSKKYIKSYQAKNISKENLLVAYTIMTQCFNKKKDNKNAYLYAQKSLELIKSIEGVKSKSLNFLHHYDLKSIKAESNKIIKSNNYFKIFLFGVLLILVFGAIGFYFYYKHQKEKHIRFLQIIQSLKEANNSNNTSLENEKIEEHQKQSLDQELLEKIANGLKKLEQKEAFLDPNFKLAFVAKKLSTNTAYLSQYFNQEIQKTFSEYTQELRIKYVLQKLNDVPHYRKYTFQAIAEEVGYKDANTFVRVFKRQTGLSPNYYLEQLSNSN